MNPSSSDGADELLGDGSSSIGDSLTAHLMDVMDAGDAEDELGFSIGEARGIEPQQPHQQGQHSPIPLDVVVRPPAQPHPPGAIDAHTATEQSADQLMRHLNQHMEAEGTHLSYSMRQDFDTSSGRLHQNEASAADRSSSHTSHRHLPIFNPVQVMGNLHVRMCNSTITQMMLQSWDKKRGLPRTHAQTMVHSARSRKQLQEGVILHKWDGSPLIGPDGTTSMKKRRKSAPATLQETKSPESERSPDRKRRATYETQTNQTEEEPSIEKPRKSAQRLSAPSTLGGAANFPTAHPDDEKQGPKNDISSSASEKQETETGEHQEDETLDRKISPSEEHGIGSN